MLTGDVNADGVVDELDAAYLVAHWGETNSLADLKGDMIVDALDIDTLQRTATESLALNDIGRVEIEGAAVVAFDPYGDNRGTGAFILIDRSTLRTVAAGMVVESLGAARNVHRHGETVTAEMRAELKA